MLDDADNRLAVVKEIKQRVQTLKAHANADSFQKELVAERTIFLALQLETMEVSALENQEINLSVYSQVLNTMLGCLRTLGLEKQIQSVETLADVIEKNKRRSRED